MLHVIILNAIIIIGMQLNVTLVGVVLPNAIGLKSIQLIILQLNVIHQSVAAPN